MTNIGGINFKQQANASAKPQFAGTRAQQSGTDSVSFASDVNKKSNSQFYIPVLFEAAIGLAVLIGAGFALKKFGLFSKAKELVMGIINKVTGRGGAVADAAEGAAKAAADTAKAAA